MALVAFVTVANRLLFCKLLLYKKNKVCLKLRLLALDTMFLKI